MILGEWSARRIAAMWLAVFLIEATIIALSAYQSREIRADMRRTQGEFDTRFVESLHDTTFTGIGLRRTNPRADSAQDSAMVLLGRVLKDSSVQRNIAGAATAVGEGITRSLIWAALLLLPLPIAASCVTLFWLWLRRRRDDHLSAQSERLGT